MLVDTKKVLLIVPAFNEEKNIKQVVATVRKFISEYTPQDYQFDLILVNDGSSDNTKKEATDSNCTVIDLRINLGIGGAMQAGYKYAYTNNYDIAIQIDGDGQHNPEFIPALLDGLKTSTSDVVIGSRFIEKKGFQSSLLRKTGIRYFKFLNKLLLGITVTDSTSGFRAFNKKAIELANKYYPDEYPEPESITYFHLNGLQITEVPVVMKDRHGGKSSISLFNSYYYMIKVTLAILFTFIRFKFKANEQR